MANETRTRTAYRIRGIDRRPTGCDVVQLEPLAPLHAHGGLDSIRVTRAPEWMREGAVVFVEAGLTPSAPASASGGREGGAA